jgi:Ca2+-binding RTX toxin-like protein
VSNVDPTVQHTLEMRLTYVDGPNNDRIEVYLDGNYIGTTTTFENYHDSLGGTHITNAIANETDRVFFRSGAHGAPQDGPGGSLDQGFYIDNLTNSLYEAPSATGNNLDNIITGNSSDNIITAGTGNDTLSGGAGDDTFMYSVGDGHDTVDGGAGTDVQVVNDNTGTSQTFNINPLDATHVGIHIVTGSDMVDPATVANAQISDINVEALELHLGSAGDTVLINGDLQSAGLTASTLYVYGGAGADTVDASGMTGTPINIVFYGGGGNDTFKGGSGNDTAYLTGATFHGGSQTVDGGGGNDTISLNDSTSITISDADLVNVRNVETIALTGGANNVTLAANADADVGGAGHTLTLDDSGASGSLTLDASGLTANLKVMLDGIGNDVLSGGAGTNIYDFAAPPNSGNDTITNFTTNKDEIAVSAKGFGGGLTVGEDVSLGGVFGSDATQNFASPNERFHFDTANSTLYYSSTGSAATAIAIAHIENGVQAHDIHVVA